MCYESIYINLSLAKILLEYIFGKEVGKFDESEIIFMLRF